MATPSVQVVDALNSLLEAEDNSIFRFVGAGSPYLRTAPPAVRQQLEEITHHLERHAKELGKLIENLGGTPLPHIQPAAEDQYLSYLSLRFLLPKLVEAKELMIRRYDNALRAVDGNPQVRGTLTRHIAEMETELDVLRKTAGDVVHVR